MLDQDQLLDILQKRYSTDNKGDYLNNAHATTLGVVVDTDDPLEQGRLRVFCPAQGDDPAKIHLLPWAVYCSPFGGIINNDTFERNGQTTKGAVAYGMWAIPELGANVLVACIDGDYRRRVWMGCVYDNQFTHTVLNGRFNWSSGGNVDGPLSSDGNPIQPAYDNAKSAFDNKTNAPEYQSRVGEYTASAINKTLSQEPNPSGSAQLDQQEPDISNAQQFEFNKAFVGGHGYDQSGFTEIPLRSSRVVGLSSPGFHSFVMDDRPFNNRTKLKSSSGHVLILDDTNDRIYLATNKGNNWVEMDSNGNIDVYSSRRVSIHSDKDINLDATGSIRMTAGQGIYGYAGGPSGLPPLSANPPNGEIRFQSQHDMHLISDNLRQLSFANTIFEIGGSFCESVGGDYFLQVENDINILNNDGDFILTVSGNYELNVLESIKEFSIDGVDTTTKGDINVYSYYGNMNLAAQKDIVQKSVSGNITLQAVGGNSGGTGAVNIKAPNSQFSANDAGTTMSTSGNMSMQSGGTMSQQANSPPQQSQPFPSDQVPDVSCSISAPVPITGYTGVDLAARVAYNAGFRGQSLTIAVAIAGAESKWNPNATGDVSLQNSKWGPSIGFWQVRTLVNPSAYPYPDNLRQNPQLYDPQANANAAYIFSKQGQNFGPWSTYMNEAYLSSSNMQPAIDAINSMCGNTSPTPTISPPQNASLFGSDHLSINAIQSIDPPIFMASPLKPSITFTDTSVIIQSIDDISLVSLNLGSSINVFSSIKDTSDLTVTTLNSVITTLDACCHSSILPISPMSDVGVTQPISQVPSNYFPYVDANSEQLFNLANFDINGRTIIT